MYTVYVLNEDGGWDHFPTEKWGAIVAYRDLEIAEAEAARLSRKGEVAAAGNGQRKTIYVDGDLVGYDPPVVEVLKGDTWLVLPIIVGDRKLACEMAETFSRETAQTVRIGGFVVLPE
jgi:hypothetical protein